MARKKATRKDYARALRYAGSYSPKSKDTKAKLEREWARFRASYRERTGQRAPSVYEYSKAFTEKATQPVPQESIPTIDFAQQYLEDFFARLYEIRQDTYDYIDNNKEGTHESGKLASIGQYKVDEMERVYQAIRDEVAHMISEYGKDAVARAMANNIELDYSIAITLLPPSDIYIVFNQTLEQLLALTSQMEVEAQRIAEQMESDYYGV